MERIQLIPEWKGSSFEKWSYIFVKKHGWRVSIVTGDFDDAMSECLSCYYCCREVYGPTVKTQAQFMSLFKLIVTNWFNTLSVKDSQIRLGMKGLGKIRRKKVDREIIIDQPSTVAGEAGLAAALTNASEDLKAILNVFLQGPQEILNVLRSEVSSENPTHLFAGVMKLCGIHAEKTSKLMNELEELLS